MGHAYWRLAVNMNLIQIQRLLSGAEKLIKSRRQAGFEIAISVSTKYFNVFFFSQKICFYLSFPAIEMEFSY